MSASIIHWTVCDYTSNPMSKMKVDLENINSLHAQSKMMLDFLIIARIDAVYGKNNQHNYWLIALFLLINVYVER